MHNRDLYQVIENYIVDNREAHYRFVYSYVKNQEDALDVIQESIYKALNSIEKLKKPEYIKTWFYRILINTALDLIRKNKRVSYIEDIDYNCIGEEDNYEDYDLQKALDSLPIKYRAIIVLRYFEDLKICDIAKIMEEPESTIKTRLYSGLKKLRIELNKEEESYGKVKRA